MTTPAPPFDPATLTDDPQIAALLDFEPVVRKCLRHDGWWPEHQYRFILGVAETGKPDQVAHALGQRTFSGAWKLRKAGGGEGFARAWDGAKALYLNRNPAPRRAPHAETLSGRSRIAASGAPGFDDTDPEEEARFKLEVFERILEKYLRKLDRERNARLEGRIVEADFYVRQLTFLEIALDLGGRALDLFDRLRRRDLHVTRISATPLSLLLDKARRAYWAERDEADRPAAAALGEHDGEVSTGERTCRDAERDGSPKEWRTAQDERHRLRAEAQQLWEEKAKADAEAWAEREAGKASGASDAGT